MSITCSFWAFENFTGSDIGLAENSKAGLTSLISESVED